MLAAAVIVTTYEQLCETGRYVTQEMLARALNVPHRTLQRWLSPRGMTWAGRPVAKFRHRRIFVVLVAYSLRHIGVFRSWSLTIQGRTLSCRAVQRAPQRMGGTPMLTNAPISDQVQREGLRVEEAAFVLGCGRTTIFQLIREKRLRVVKIGARTIVPRAEIARFLAEATERGGDAA